MIKKFTTVFTAFAIVLSLCSFNTPYPSLENAQDTKAASKIVYDKKKNSITLSWPAFGTSGNYVITRGGSRLATSFVAVGSTSK